MSSRETCPVGAPCWADLWTSDVDRSIAFYGALLGWEALEPNPEFGGYFMFTRNGVPVAGGFGDMGDMKADNSWKIYLASADIDATTAAVASQGGTVIVPPMPVADLGWQLVLTDPTGAAIGSWQAGTFPGFTVLDEPGAPSWFELHTRDSAAALSFYQSVFGWETTTVGDTDEFRYSTMHASGDDVPLAGVFDASGILPEGVGPSWTVYWEVADVAASVEVVRAHAGSVVAGPEVTPYGTVATITDPTGAVFRLRTGGV